MAEEKEDNLFEELNFGSFIDGLEDSIGSEEETETIENEEEITEENSETDLQGDDESLEDAPVSEEETSEEEIDSETEDTEEDTEDNSSPLIPYAKLLVDDGILPNFNLDEFDGSAEGLKSAMNTEISEGIEYYKKSLPDEVKHLLDNYEEGVPLSKLLSIDEKRTEYKSINQDKLSENKDLQKAIMRDYYKNTTKFPDSKIDKLIQISDDLENLEGESKEALTDLISFQDEYEEEAVNNAKQDKVNAEKEREKSLSEFKDTLEKSDEIIPNIKINKNIKDNLFKIMTTPVGADEFGNPVNKIAQYRVENPYKFDIMLAYLFETTKGFKDWTVLSSAGKNSAVKSFDKAIERQNYKGNTGKTPSRPKSKTGNKNLLEEIEKFNFK